MAAFRLACALSLLTLVLGRPMATGVPEPSIAKTQLDGLTVASSLSGGGYSRDMFEHWHTVSGACNTRETVLQRDGKDVVTDSSCRATTGVWFSPFDGKTWTNADDVDIDHMVPLKNAWVSGARLWDNQTREIFANDLVRPQLWAVTDDINQEKGDKSPDKWKPPLTSFHCTYASSWITVKSHWNLTITTPEKAALGDMISTCGSAQSSTADSNSTANMANGAKSGPAALVVPVGVMAARALLL